MIVIHLCWPGPLIQIFGHGILVTAILVTVGHGILVTVGHVEPNFGHGWSRLVTVGHGNFGHGVFWSRLVTAAWNAELSDQNSLLVTFGHGRMECRVE